MYIYMGMSETLSNTSPGDSWAQFYQHNNNSGATMFSDRVSDATVVTTTVSSTTTPSSTMNAGGGGATTHLNPEGRVSKPIRRRSRASRRTPTTLLNTDTTNFRAMVQQFTGGPTAPFATGPNSNPANFFLGLGTRQQIVNPSSTVMVPSGAYPHIQFQQQQHLHHHQQQQQQQHQQYMFSVNNNSGTTQGGHGDHGFIQRLANSRPSMEMNVPGGGFSMEGVSSHVAPHPRPPSSDEDRNVNGNNYMF